MSLTSSMCGGMSMQSKCKASSHTERHLRNDVRCEPLGSLLVSVKCQGGRKEEVEEAEESG